MAGGENCIMDFVIDFLDRCVGGVMLLIGVCTLPYFNHLMFLYF